MAATLHGWQTGDFSPEWLDALRFISRRKTFGPPALRSGRGHGPLLQSAEIPKRQQPCNAHRDRIRQRHIDHTSV